MFESEESILELRNRDFCFKLMRGGGRLLLVCHVLNATTYNDIIQNLSVKKYYYNFLITTKLKYVKFLKQFARGRPGIFISFLSSLLSMHFTFLQEE